ncbi:hypothetical protein KC340_g123 [Hortaea werneckii]|nr:hypothetical protein KC340_g123 [Hortaea werneckii]
MHDHSTVFATDLCNLSIGACQRSSPVSLRSSTAFRLSRTEADKQYPKTPSPICKLIYKPTNYRTHLRTHERRRSIDHHRRTELILREHITYCTACHAQEGTAGQAIEKANDEHRLNVLSYGARDKPNEVHAERAQVDDTSTIELRERPTVATSRLTPNSGSSCW